MLTLNERELYVLDNAINEAVNLVNLDSVPGELVEALDDLRLVWAQIYNEGKNVSNQDTN